MELPEEVSCVEFLARCDATKNAPPTVPTSASDSLPVLLDVREPWELQIASVKTSGFTLRAIPMGQVMREINTLDRHQTIACLCHHGVRSMQVARYLKQQGFSQVVNLQGGIDAWSQEVDASVPRY